MAPPNFPNGMTLYSIGFAALKYPDLPVPPVSVPLNNQVGALQYQPSTAQNHQVVQIASQYIDTLLEYQTTDATITNDTSSPQYYFSTALCLLNFLNMNPDVCKRIAAHPTLINNLIGKMLADDFEKNMANVKRPQFASFPPSSFEDEFGSLLQFLSTILLFKAEIGELHPRINELVAKANAWKAKYRNSRVRTIPNAAGRVADQIQGMDPTMISMMRNMQEETLVCGVSTCKVVGVDQLTFCSSCRIQRYCGKDHQKLDWKYHKVICSKGLQEP